MTLCKYPSIPVNPTKSQHPCHHREQKFHQLFYSINEKYFPFDDNRQAFGIFNKFHELIESPEAMRLSKMKTIRRKTWRQTLLSLICMGQMLACVPKNYACHGFFLFDLFSNKFHVIWFVGKWHEFLCFQCDWCNFLGFKRFQWAKYQEKDAILDFYVILFYGGISIILFSKNLFNEKKWANMA